MKVLFIILSLLILTTPAASDENISGPAGAFEWGAGFVAFRANHYRGSDQYINHVWPLPYFHYSSDVIEAEQSFIKGLFYHNDYISLKLSLSLGLGVESKSNNARKGMPDLDYSFEVGPMLIVKILELKDQKLLLNFEFPLREVVATDLTYLKGVGQFYVPYLNLIFSSSKRTMGWSGEFSVAAMFGSRDYHEYYYSVKLQYALAGRSAYSAPGGYSGQQYALILKRYFGRILLIPFFRYDNLMGVAFKGSPLYRRSDYFLFGIGCALLL